METSPLHLCRESWLHRPEKRGILRRIKRHISHGAILLVEDEITLRLFPPLRNTWGLKGRAVRIPVSGRNAKRVLFGAINAKTGHRIALGRPRTRQIDFHVLLREIRRRYRDRKIVLLLDKASCHKAANSQVLARELNIVLVFLPTQWPELNAMDHVWKYVQGQVAANRQYDSVTELEKAALDWLYGLSPAQALTKAGLRSKDCWLRNLF